MRLYDRTHPRKPDWTCYSCDECGDTFWSDLASTKGPHRCSDCRKPRSASVHFTTGNVDQAATADRHYHGGQFHRGEW